MSFTIAHFSDFHLSRIDEDFHRSLAMVRDAVSQRVHHIAITGDIVDAAEWDVYKAFYKELKKLRVNSRKRLSIVPGNHDIYPWGRRVRVQNPGSAFEKIAKLTINGTQLLRHEHYPYAKIIAPHVVLAGIDSTRNGRLNPLHWAEGELEKDAMEAVAAFFKKHPSSCKILLLHHHPWAERFGYGWLNQNFAEPLPATAAKWIHASGANVVLCGHVHEEASVEKRSIGRGCRVYRCGASGGMHDADETGEKTRVYQILDIGTKNKVTAVKRAFCDSELDEMIER